MASGLCRMRRELYSFQSLIMKGITDFLAIVKGTHAPRELIVLVPLMFVYRHLPAEEM